MIVLLILVCVLLYILVGMGLAALTTTHKERSDDCQFLLFLILCWPCLLVLLPFVGGADANPSSHPS